MTSDEEPPQLVVQRWADAFNRQDTEALLENTAPNCIFAAYGGGAEKVGATAVLAWAEEVFAERPKVRLNPIGRMSHGDIVIQQEKVFRGLSEAERRIAVYRVANAQVTRVEFIR
jgi:hypothetical protein